MHTSAVAARQLVSDEAAESPEDQVWIVRLPRSMASRLLITVLTLFTACSSPSAGRRAARPRSDSVAGCDRARLREVLHELGARRRNEVSFRDRVPVGAPKRTALARCEAGEPVASCRRLHQRRGRHLWIAARTALRSRIVAVEPTTELERELSDLSQGDARFEFGRNVRERVLTESEVCVREYETRRIRVESVTASGADPLTLLRAESEHRELVFDISDDDQFSVRCAAREEVTGTPEVPADGPCASLASAELTYDASPPP